MPDNPEPCRRITSCNRERPLEIDQTPSTQRNDSGVIAGWSGYVLDGLMIVAPVRPENIHAEVAYRIAPHRMDVVRVTSRVVVLHQQTMALDAVIVRPPRVEAAGPRQVQRGELGSSDIGHLALRDCVGQATHVRIEQSPQDFLLRCVHRRRAQALRHRRETHCIDMRLGETELGFF